METKTIALDREAYELLRRRKRSGESFSEAVKRLARQARPLSSFAGVWRKHLSKADLDAIEKALVRGRETGLERTRRILTRQR